MNEDPEKTHKYQCGICKFIITIGPKDQIRCSNCGYRIFYKLRPNTWTQYEAR